MSSIKTYTGVMFDPVNPESELIDILDIAHVLSMLCRANGHFRSFYSVGQHCINCAMEAKARGYSKRVQLACLLHDASEAYLSDVTRPVKHELPKYLEIEKPLQESIWQKYLGSALTEEENSQVFRIDDAMLYGLVHNSSRADPCACRNVYAGSCNRCVYRYARNCHLGCDRNNLN